MSVVSDTHLEVLVLTRLDFTARLGERLLHFLNDMLYIDRPLAVSDNEVRSVESWWLQLSAKRAGGRT
jgi:hypothetical protein